MRLLFDSELQEESSYLHKYVIPVVSIFAKIYIVLIP